MLGRVGGKLVHDHCEGLGRSCIDDQIASRDADLLREPVQLFLHDVLERRSDPCPVGQHGMRARQRAQTTVERVLRLRERLPFDETPRDDGLYDSEEVLRAVTQLLDQKFLTIVLDQKGGDESGRQRDIDARCQVSSACRAKLKVGARNRNHPATTESNTAAMPGQKPHASATKMMARKYVANGTVADTSPATASRTRVAMATAASAMA